MKALDGIKVLDFTHVQSGPTCTQILGWFGADVIKVERPGVGDATRKQLIDVPGADSLYFTMLNHNKRSIELNSKNETGKEVLTRLIEECDVLVENFSPGTLAGYGLGSDVLRQINPRLISLAGRVSSLNTLGLGCARFGIPLFAGCKPGQMQGMLD